MLEAHAKLYLPISADTLQSVVMGRSNFDTSHSDNSNGDESCSVNSNNDHAGFDSNIARLLTSLVTHEIASLFFLMHLSQLSPKNNAAVEQFLSDCINACQQQRINATDEEYLDICLQQLDCKKISSGFYLLPEYQTVPMDSLTLASGSFLTDLGAWNFEFCSSHRQHLKKDLIEVNIQSNSVSLSPEQSRIYRELMAGQDEHVHIQGYAGTGKTTLVKSLLSLLESTPAKVLVLAERKAQLDVFHLVARESSKVQVFTYTDLAKLIISDSSTELGEETILRKGITRATMPDSVIIEHLGLRDSGSIKALQLVKAIRATVFRFCQTDDDEFTNAHIPKSYQGFLDAPTQGAVSQYAHRLWQSILRPPTKEFTPQIRAYHIIKWAALNRCVIPNTYTHVLIDECHDLPVPVNQILSNSAQARISLGDDYQNLSGNLMKSPTLIRQREMHHSLRSSHQIEGLLNPIISAHPSKVNATFFGNRMNRLELAYYEKAQIPSEPSLILVKDYWGLFEWTQRLAAGRVSFNLMGNKVDLDTFVQDCIELYNNGTRARHGELFRFTSWRHLTQHYGSNFAFTRVHRMLEKNYAQQDWQQAQTAILDSVGNAYLGNAYSLALVDSVRNLEFDNVLVTPQLLTMPKQVAQLEHDKKIKKRNAVENASFYAAVYVAVTRARKKLTLPSSLRNHIEEIS